MFSGDYDALATRSPGYHVVFGGLWCFSHTLSRRFKCSLLNGEALVTHSPGNQVFSGEVWCLSHSLSKHFKCSLVNFDGYTIRYSSVSNVLWWIIMVQPHVLRGIKCSLVDYDVLAWCRTFMWIHINDFNLRFVIWFTMKPERKH